MKKLEIIYKKIEELKAYNNNPRENEGAVKYVAESIKNFGFKVPLVIDKENVIVCGHTRVLAAEQLELEEVPCIIADDLTEEQIKSFRLVDNKVSEFAEWDFTKLEEELSNIELDMQQFGFEEIEKIDVEQFFEDDDADNEAEPKEEEKEEIQCPHCNMWFIKE